MDTDRKYICLSMKTIDETSVDKNIYMIKTHVLLITKLFSED